VFRFTTSLIGKSERREVNIQVGVATIGIRGTDVWGRAGSDGSLVALLEGKAQMDMPGHATMMMDQPMHYNMMPAAGQMQMNMAVTPANVADWAAQTDVAEGKGVLSAEGRWTVSLASSTNPAETERMIKQLADAGYPAEQTTATVKGREWHRLVIMQAATLQDARAIATSLGKQFPFMSPWVYPSKQ
jgi:septal ring-binding cell division protein DamX